MKTFEYQRAHNLVQLHDELLEHIPRCRPTPQQDGSREAVARVEGRSDDLIRVTVPDDVAEADVTAVVDAHVADPNYGGEVRLTENDVLTMPDRDLRRWLAQQLITADVPTGGERRRTRRATPT